MAHDIGGEVFADMTPDGFRLLNVGRRYPTGVLTFPTRTFA